MWGRNCPVRTCCTRVTLLSSLPTVFISEAKGVDTELDVNKCLQQTHLSQQPWLEGVSEMEEDKEEWPNTVAAWNNHSSVLSETSAKLGWIWTHIKWYTLTVLGEDQKEAIDREMCRSTHPVHCRITCTFTQLSIYLHTHTQHIVATECVCKECL